MKISKTMTLKDLALYVGSVLKLAGIDCVLTGGAVVSIYTDNSYLSHDLDFITHSRTREIDDALKQAGFYRDGRYFKHADTDFFLEFPSPPVAIGRKPITVFNEISKGKGYLKLLTPTHCVMDRLAAFYFWNDRQALSQAVLVGISHEINTDEIRLWSEQEGMLEKYGTFLDELHRVKKKKKK